GNSLVYTSFVGGSGGDSVYGIALDASGDAFVTGTTDSIDFPTMSPFQTDQPGEDAFVTKLSPSGNALVYSTYLGGSDKDDAADIAVDASGGAYVTGSTISADFPTMNPFQTDRTDDVRDADVFVTKLNWSGNGLVYSTYLGGAVVDPGYSA